MSVDLSKYTDLLEGPKRPLANLATVMPDGTPQVTPVWFDWHDGAIRINTAKGRVKARNMKPGAAVALAIVDPDNPYRYVQIRGRVRRMTEEGAAAHIDQLSRKYLGHDYEWGKDDRIIFEIEPFAVQGMG
jgi:PPOX class probable F420-dependent enzyme